MRKVYVAGPWVFRPDAKEHAEYLRNVLLDAGYEALIPIDNECDQALQIKVSNLTMIEDCDYVIADITPFRGPSADVGTVFEMGYARALNKTIFPWSSDQSEYKTRVEPDGMHIEDFGCRDNLMVAAGEYIDDSFEESVRLIVQWDR
ncbi:Nucleoside 2-deoxyribosyltransferase [compost metagenome]